MMTTVLTYELCMQTERQFHILELLTLIQYAENAEALLHHQVRVHAEDDIPEMAAAKIVANGLTKKSFSRQLYCLENKHMNSKSSSPPVSRVSSPPTMHRLSPTTIATLSGQKRPSDAAYEHLVRSLPPIDLHAFPQKKSLKRVYGPIRPPPQPDPYLENLRKTSLINPAQKTKRYRSHVTKAWETEYASANSPVTPRIRFGKKQTVRIPKKTQEFKQNWRKLKQKNRSLKQTIFPDLSLETDDDRTLTDQLISELPSDVEEDTEAIVYSPTINEEPVPDIPPSYKIHTYVKNLNGSIARIKPQEQTVDLSTTFEDLLVTADDVAEEQGLRPLNTYVGVINETNIFHPFEIMYQNLAHRLYHVDKHLKNGIISVIYDLSPAKNGGKRRRKNKK